MRGIKISATHNVSFNLFPRLLGLASQQNVDLLFDPVFVVRLVGLCVSPVPVQKQWRQAQVFICRCFKYQVISLYSFNCSSYLIC